MTLNAEMVVRSHLNDSQIELGFDLEQVSLRLKFVSWLIFKLDGNLNQIINPVELFKEFSNQ
jgi:hypothetical protein